MKWQAAAVLLITFEFFGSPAQAATCATDRAVFVGGNAPVSVQVEIADDATERAQGLMYRRDLAVGTGMLFIYETPQPVSFWMRNTLIPLDMIFVAASGEVRYVHAMARPNDETAISGAAIGDPDPNRLMVLEVGGGEAARLGIHPGMVLAHPGLPQHLAKARCS